MADPFVGEIRAFGFYYAPADWLQCNGQLLPPGQFSVLQAVIGNLFGGTYPTSFALPNLQGNVIVGQGQGPGLTPRDVGETGGSQTVTLSASQMANHDHIVWGYATGGSATAQMVAAPSAAVQLSNAVTMTTPLVTTTPYVTDDDAVNTSLSPMSLSSAGSGASHDNCQPYLVHNYCICTSGEFPVRPS